MNTKVAAQVETVAGAISAETTAAAASIDVAMTAIVAATPVTAAVNPSACAVPLTALDLAFARFLQQTQPGSDARYGWLAALVSHQYGRGHACLDLMQLTQSNAKTLGWDASASALLPVDLASAAASLPWTQGPSSPLVLEGARLYLRRNWQAEHSIRASIDARLAQPGRQTPGLAAALDALFAPSTGPEPDWQKVACAIAVRGHFTLITGGPGTGKTTTVVRLLALLQSQAERPLRVALAAPTGKAAARLGESIARAVQTLPASMQANIPTQAQTLHKLLQVRSSLRVDATPALALDVVVVDEASMIDLALMARLLAAVPLTARLILLGDKDQLASVEAGAVLGQLCQGADAGGYRLDTVRWVEEMCGQDISAWAGDRRALAQQTVMLRHSHRFAADSVIGQWASAVNAGDRAAVGALWEATPSWPGDAVASVTRLPFGSGKAFALGELVRHGWRDWLAALHGSGVEAGTTETLLTSMGERDGTATRDDAQALQCLQLFGQFQVLCALRDGPWGVHALNAQIARALGFAAQGWYAGRPVMVTRNDYHLGLMNGDVGLCLPTARGLRVAFAQTDAAGKPGVRWVLPSRLDAVETVFAMTVHKSQGSEFAHVVLVLPDRVAPVLTRELIYTGITRAKQHLTLALPQTGVLRQAVAQKVWRSGGLAATA